MSAATVTVLEAAIEQRDWEAAALCLLLGVARAARRFPPDALGQMLAELSTELEPKPHRQRGPRRDRA